jgi:serine/threonine protein kinase
MRAVSDGTRLGKYQLLRRLATGGMAELFLARAVAMAGFEKLVVLKRILPQHAESEDFIKMFLTEARLAATLHHPNIVQVYDIGEEGGHFFFTMEWVQGQDLRKIVRAARKANTAVPLEHVLHIIGGIAAALDHAHDKKDTDGTPIGIVHRDVSPSNVLVTYDGAVKLVDFGIAKAAAFQSNTIAGTLKGKVPYMSPEQCRGENVDRRSDIFSIGTLLWEMTTGARLFAGDNEVAIINRVARADVPTPTSIRSDYPPELEAIVMRALASDPEQRYQHAVDLQIDLEDFSREHRLPVSSARMGKFMRELFAEEIAAQTAQLHAERSERPDAAASRSGPVPSLSSASLPPVPSLAGPTAQTIVEPGDILELPSEIRVRTPTPRVESEVSRSSVTRAERSGDSSGTYAVRRRPAWKVLAVASVALGALGWGALAMLPTDTREVSTVPAPVVVGATVEPEPPPAQPPQVEAPPVVVVAPAADDEVELLPDAEGSKPPAEVAKPGPAAPDPTPTATAQPAKPDPKPDAKPVAKPGPSPTKPDKKPDPKKPPPSSDTVKKPKWDPDNPMPPM